jgi:gamma-glutamyltranspeptidase/glutathione hydrolase
MSIEEALAAPRVSQRNSMDATSSAEPLFTASGEAAALQALGHMFTGMDLIGAATALEFKADGNEVTVTAVAEPVRRNGGSAMVVSEK